MTVTVADAAAPRWKGRPYAGLQFHPSDVFLIPFSIAWASPVFTMLFGIGGWRHAPGSDGSPVFIWPILFIFPLAAIYLTVGRFAIDIWRRRSLTYELTEREAIIRDSFPRAQERRIDLTRLPEIVLKRGRNGFGTIEFGTSSWMAGFARGGYGFGPLVPSFESIPNVDTVYAMVRATAR